MASTSLTLERPAGHHRTIQVIAALLCVFIVLVPKGGIKAIGLPITWGYLLLIFSFIYSLPTRLLTYRMFYSRRLLITLATIVSFLYPFLLFHLGKRDCQSSVLRQHVYELCRSSLPLFHLLSPFSASVGRPSF